MGSRFARLLGVELIHVGRDAEDCNPLRAAHVFPPHFLEKEIVVDFKKMNSPQPIYIWNTGILFQEIIYCIAPSRNRNTIRNHDIRELGKTRKKYGVGDESPLMSDEMVTRGRS